MNEGGKGEIRLYIYIFTIKWHLTLFSLMCQHFCHILKVSMYSTLTFKVTFPELMTFWWLLNKLSSAVKFCLPRTCLQ